MGALCSGSQSCGEAYKHRSDPSGPWEGREAEDGRQRWQLGLDDTDPDLHGNYVQGLEAQIREDLLDHF